MKRKLSCILVLLLWGMIILIGAKKYINSPEESAEYKDDRIGSLETNDMDYEYGYFQSSGVDPYISIERFGEYIQSVEVSFEDAKNLDSITLYYGNPSISPENQKTVWIDKEYGTAKIRLYKNASRIRVDLNPLEGERARVRINSIQVNTSRINRWLVSGLLMMIVAASIFLLDTYSVTITEWVIKALISSCIMIGIALFLPCAPGFYGVLILLAGALTGMTALFDTRALREGSCVHESPCDGAVRKDQVSGLWSAKDSTREKIFWILLVLAVMLIMCMEAIHMPYNFGPDEDMHMDICRYIYQHHQLPDARNPEIINEMFGFSYALFPITGFIISGIFMIMASNWLPAEMLYIPARMANVIFSLITIILLIFIARKIFRRPYDKLFVMAIAFLPQFLFVAGYVNSDAFGLMTVAMIIWCMLRGREKRWNAASCIYLGLSIGACLLSYYNCYVIIPVAAGYAISSFLADRKVVATIGGKKKEDNISTAGIDDNGKNDADNKARVYIDLAKCIGITMLVALAVAGWWFVRNGILYDGDIIGFATKSKLQAVYAWDELKPGAFVTEYGSGRSVLETLLDRGWIVKSCKSYIMSYGYMSVWLKDWIYIVAAVFINILLFGNLLVVKKGDIEDCGRKDKALHISMLAICILTISISFIYSYFMDYQPQGRYLLPMYIGFAYILVGGAKKLVTATGRVAGDMLLWIFYGLLIALELTALFVGVFIDCVTVL